MTASDHQFDHRIDVKIGRLPDLDARGSVQVLFSYRTDTGRLLRVQRSSADCMLVEVVDPTTGQRARTDLEPVLNRVGQALLEHLGATTFGAAPEPPEEPPLPDAPPDGPGAQPIADFSQEAPL
ncbi:MAG: hypothetical protein AAGH43_06030 [Pseudomonadota bacterium]